MKSPTRSIAWGLLILLALALVPVLCTDRSGVAPAVVEQVESPTADAELQKGDLTAVERSETAPPPPIVEAASEEPGRAHRIRFRAWTLAGEPYPAPVSVIGTNETVMKASRVGYLRRLPHREFGVIEPHGELTVEVDPAETMRFVAMVGADLGTEGHSANGFVDFRLPEPGAVTVRLQGLEPGGMSKIALRSTQGEVGATTSSAEHKFDVVPFATYLVEVAAGAQAGSAWLEHYAPSSEIEIELTAAGTLVMTVIDAKSGEAITDARVFNLQGRELETEQASAGAYHLSPLEWSPVHLFCVEAPGFARSFVQFQLSEATRLWERTVRLEQGLEVEVLCFKEGVAVPGTRGTLFYRNLRPRHRPEVVHYCSIDAVSDSEGVLRFQIPEETELIGLYAQHSGLLATGVLRGETVSRPGRGVVELEDCPPLKVTFSGGEGHLDPLSVWARIEFPEGGRKFFLQRVAVARGGHAVIPLMPSRFGYLEVWSRTMNRLAQVSVSTPRPSELVIPLASAGGVTVQVLDVKREPESGVVECMTMDGSRSLGSFRIEVDGTVRIAGIEDEKCRAFVRLEGDSTLLSLGVIPLGSQPLRFVRSPGGPWYLPDN